MRAVISTAESEMKNRSKSLVALRIAESISVWLSYMEHQQRARLYASVLWHCWLGDKKSIRPVKSCPPISISSSLQVFEASGLIWSNLGKNTPIKQKPKVSRSDSVGRWCCTCRWTFDSAARADSSIDSCFARWKMTAVIRLLYSGRYELRRLSSQSRSQPPRSMCEKMFVTNAFTNLIRY